MKKTDLIYDGHIHMPNYGFDRTKHEDTPAEFAKKAKSIGIEGGLIISPCPASDNRCFNCAEVSNRTRLEAVLDYCSQLKNYYPCYWINPTEPDAVHQVTVAKEMGIRALKVECSFYHPSAGLECYRMAAQLDMPILFHAGILWDGEASADFNRPANWECMLDVYGCRFCLAHVAWPWQSECMALFGKLNQASFARKDRKCDMYIDCAPGTPEIDRADIFRRFALLGYNLADKLIWGIDSHTDDYCVDYAKWIYDWDKKMFRELQEQWGSWQGYRCKGSFIAAKEGKRDFCRIFDNALHKNLLRFLGEKI